MAWTEENVEQLKALWHEGLSSSQIAAQLEGVTRNAVIGKVHRLKLAGRERPAPPPEKEKAEKMPKPEPERVGNVGAFRWGNANTTRTPPLAITCSEVPKVSADIIPISRRLPLVALSEKTCKWPSGSGRDSTFCGNDALGKSPYCTYHDRVAYVPIGERRRMR